LGDDAIFPLVCFGLMVLVLAVILLNEWR